MEYYTNQDVAIVGIALRLPEEINSGLSYFERLSEGKEVKSKFEFPWEFSGKYFNISEKEAQFMDPQERILLELARECLENGNSDLDKYNRKVGVYTSTTNSDFFKELCLNHGELLEDYKQEIYKGNISNQASSRISYKLDLHGTSTSIGEDSASAINLAYDSLLKGENDYALVGAASINLFSDEDRVSASPYSNDAEGISKTDGVAMILLKRAQDAQNDGDFIYSTIAAATSNNDGSRGVSLEVASIEGQTDVISSAINQAGIGPKDIFYIEGNGSSTLLSDQIELNAIKNNFEKEKVYIGSSKANIGDTGNASTLFSLIKLVLMSEHSLVPPLKNFTSPNEYFDWEDSKVEVNKNSISWLEDRNFMGLLSSSNHGNNSFILMKRASPNRKNKEEKNEYYFPIVSYDLDQEEKDILNAKRDVDIARKLNYLDELESSYASKARKNKENITCGIYLSNLEDDMRLVKQDELASYSKYIVDSSNLGTFWPVTNIPKEEYLYVPVSEFGKSKEYSPQESSNLDIKDEDGNREISIENIKNIYAKYLTSKEIDQDALFSELGGGSLQIVSLLSEINNYFKVDIPISYFLYNSSINKVYDYLTGAENLAEEKDNDVSHIYERMEKYIESLELDSKKDLPISTGKKIFITGATGFLGIHLVAQLTNEGQDVICLERNGDKDRIINLLKKYKIYNEQNSSKIFVIKGNLEEENLGLSKEEFDKLSADISSIIHLGAKVNHRYPLEELLEVNTYSIETIINLALDKEIKKIIFMSSVAVYGGEDTREVFDFDDINVESSYGYSKYFAEMYLRALIEKNFPVSILRAGDIFGHDQNFIPNEKDATWNLIRAIEILKSAPEEYHDGIPLFYAMKVNEVTDIISSVLGINVDILNIVGDLPIYSDDILKAIERDLGDDIKRKPVEEWKGDLESIRNQGIWVEVDDSKSVEFVDIENEKLYGFLPQVEISDCDPYFLSKNIESLNNIL